MSNFGLYLHAAGKDYLGAAVTMAFGALVSGGKATHYIKNSSQISLYWAEFHGHPPDNKPSTPLPYPMDVDAAIDFIWNFLRETKLDLPPDVDGSCTPDAFFLTSHSSSYHILTVKKQWRVCAK